MELKVIFDELHKVKLCNSAYEFSTNYLGKSKSYYSMLKSKNMEPSIDALSILELVLNEKASLCVGDKFGIVKTRRKKLLKLCKKANALKKQFSVERLNQHRVAS